MERSIQAIDERADAAIVEKKRQIRSEVRDDLRQELVTRELFEERMKVIDERFKSLGREMNERFKSLETEINERFNVVDEKFKSLNFKLNILVVSAAEPIHRYRPAGSDSGQPHLCCPGRPVVPVTYPYKRGASPGS